MCVTAIIAAGAMIAGAAGAAATSIASANANKRAANYEAAMQTKQLYREQQQQQIAALQQENARSTEFQQYKSSALAAIGMSGVGEHISFFQGTDPEGKRNFLRDVANVRLNMTASRSSIADQVGVTEYKRRINVFNANMSKVNAIAEFVKTAAQAATMVGSYGTPSPAGAGGGDVGGGYIGRGSGAGDFGSSYYGG